LSRGRHSSKIISLKEGSFLKNKFDKDKGHPVYMNKKERRYTGWSQKYQINYTLWKANIK